MIRYRERFCGSHIEIISNYLDYIDVTMPPLFKQSFSSLKEEILKNIEVLLLDDRFKEKFLLEVGNYKWSCSFVDYYIISLAYCSNKRNGNYDNFCAIIDDIKDIDTGCIDNDLFFIYIGNLIKVIVENENYKDIPNLRRCLKQIITVRSRDDSLKYVDIDRQIERLYNDRCIYSDIDSDYFNKVLDARVGYLIDLQDNSKKMYYSRILLYGDRYFYFNDKLHEIESNSYIKKVIFSYIIKFDYKMFNELNIDCKKDSFITCMDIVFDSDSYHELFSKLDAIVYAGGEYGIGNKADAFKIVKELKSDSYKRKYKGCVVSYPNCMNMKVKPKTILDREKEICSRIDSSISYNFMDDLQRNFTSVSAMYDFFDDNVKNEKKLSIKIKRKLENLFRK